MKLRLLPRLRLLRILQVNGLNSRFLNRKPMPTTECCCKNCGTRFTGFYCPRCGQSAKTRRLSWLNAIDDVVGLVTNLDSGILRSCTELFWRPGHMMRDYVEGHRKGYMKPLSMLFCLSTIYYFFIIIFAKEKLAKNDLINLEDHEESIIPENYTPLLQTLGDYLTDLVNNPGLVNLLLILPMIPITWLCFRKTRLGKAFNFMEIANIQVLMACQMLIVSIGASFLDLLHGGVKEVNLNFNFLLVFLLFMWDFKQLYHLRWWQSFRRTVLCLLLTTVLAVSVIVLTAGGVYLVVNNS